MPNIVERAHRYIVKTMKDLHMYNKTIRSGMLLFKWKNIKIRICVYMHMCTYLLILQIRKDKPETNKIGYVQGFKQTCFSYFSI